METSQAGLLKTKRFLPLFLAQFLGAFNDNLFKNALVILITYQLAERLALNAQIIIALASALFILPFFLFSEVAGQCADKYEKSFLIRWIKAAEIGIMCVAGIGFYTQALPILLATLFILGTHSALFGPLKYAILPDHLEANELIAGNGLVEAGTFLAILIGTLLGGVLILNHHGVLIISTLMIGLAIIGWVASCFIPKTQSHNPKLKIQWNIIQDTWQLLYDSKDNQTLLRSIIGISWLWFVGAIFMAGFPVFAKDILYADETVISLFVAIFSIGVAMGALSCNQLLKGKTDPLYAPAAAFGMMLFTLDLCVSVSHASTIASGTRVGFTDFLQNLQAWRMTADLLMISICAGLYTVPLYALIQQHSAPDHRSRNVAISNVLSSWFMVLSTASILFSVKMKLSITGLFLCVGIGNGLIALYLCRLVPGLLSKTLIRIALKCCYNITLSDKHQILSTINTDPHAQKTLIIVNHTGYIDTFLLYAFLPGPLLFLLTPMSIPHSRLKWFFKKMLPIQKLETEQLLCEQSITTCIQNHQTCVIFPEGRPSVTGSLMQTNDVVGIVAAKTQIRLLPLYIYRSEHRTMARRVFTITAHPLCTLPPHDPAHPIDPLQRQYQIDDLMQHAQFNSTLEYKTLFESLCQAQKKQGRHAIIIEDMDKIPITYGVFITRVFILSRLIAKNTAVGEYVGVLLPNVIPNALTFFALQASARIPVMLNYSSGIHGILSATLTAKIKTVCTSHRFVKVANLETMIEALQKESVQILYLEELRSHVTFTDKIKGMVSHFFPTIAYHYWNRQHPQWITDPETPAVILFTSGSEGISKGVVLSHQNIQANRNQIGTILHFNRQDVLFNALPLFHSVGLTAGLLAPILSGIRIFLYPSPLHYKEIPTEIYHANTTILFGTDTFLAGYAKCANPYDFYSLRCVFAGAEKLREETQSLWLQKFGIRVLEGYGTTETSPVLSANTPLHNKKGTVGRLLPGIQYRIQPVPGIDEGGILEVCGPNIMKGYLLNTHPGVIVPLQQRWYATGDVVSVDPYGFITIAGRMKRFAKIAGEMVSLALIETVINTLWPEYQNAAISVTDPKKGERIILATNNPQATRIDMVNHMRTQNYPEIAIPKTVMILEHIPVLATGKTNYLEVQRLFQARQESAG
jgi:acyl-[acyl-carrier-protein]-phospholipid O-acyltransferase/long-chain-fatty-acid--[acyl-carrier-protein] ligase